MTKQIWPLLFLFASIVNAQNNTKVSILSLKTQYRTRILGIIQTLVFCCLLFALSAHVEFTNRIQD